MIEGLLKALPEFALVINAKRDANEFEAASIMSFEYTAKGMAYGMFTKVWRHVT
jgi:hypothetical protein